MTSNHSFKSLLVWLFVLIFAACALAKETTPKPVQVIQDFEGKKALRDVTATNADLKLIKSGNDVLAGVQSLEVTFKPAPVSEVTFTKLPKVSWSDYAAFTLFAKVKGQSQVKLRLGITDSTGSEYLPELVLTNKPRPIEVPTLWMLEGFSPRGWCNDRVDLGSISSVRLVAVELSKPVTIVLDDVELVKREPLPAVEDLRTLSGNGYVILKWTPVPGAEYYNIVKSISIARQLKRTQLLGLTTLPYLYDPAVENGVEYTYRMVPVDKYARIGGLSNPAGAIPTASRPASPLVADRFGGMGAREYDMKGNFYLHKEGERWLLVDPVGGLYFALGVDHVGFDRTFTKVQGNEEAYPELAKEDVRKQFPAAFKQIKGTEYYSPYLKKVIEKYSDDQGNWLEGWTGNTLDRLRAMKFNLLGRKCEPSLVKQKLLAYLVSFDLPADLPEVAPGVPDVFAADFEAKVPAVVKAQAAKVASDALVVGYDLGNLAPAHLQGRGDTFLADAALHQAAGGAARQAFLDFLKQKYTDAAGLSKAWHVTLSAFDDSAANVLLNADGAAARADKAEFAALFAKRYLQIVVPAVKQADSKHLLFGPRFDVGASSALAKAVASQVDVLQVNCDMLEFPYERFAELYAAAQKPMIVTGFAIAASDSGLPNKKGASYPVADQQERALMFQRFLYQSLQRPYMLGVLWDGYVDYPKTGDLFGRDSGVGLADVNDTLQPFAARTLEVANFNAFLVGAPEGFFHLNLD